MNETQTLADWNLAVECARQIGWRNIVSARDVTWETGRPEGVEFLGEPPVTSAYCARNVPAYHESLDACFRDLVPVLKERGLSAWWLQGNIDGSAGCVLGADGEGDDPYWTVGSGACSDWQSPATAFCRAFLKAMEASEEPITNANQ